MADSSLSSSNNGYNRNSNNNNNGNNNGNSGNVNVGAGGIRDRLKNKINEIGPTNLVYMFLAAMCLLLLGLVVKDMLIPKISSAYSDHAVAFVSTFVAVALVISIIMFLKYSQDEQTKKIIKLACKYGVAIGAVMLIIWAISYFTQVVTAISWLSTLLFVAIILFALAIAFKFLQNSKNNPPIVDFIINVILYIPCMFVNAFEGIYNSIFVTQITTSKSITLLLIAEIALIILYFMIPYIRTKYYEEIYIGGDKHGKLLVNEPRDTTEEYIVISYIELNCPEDNKTISVDDDVPKPAETEEENTEESESCPSKKDIVAETSQNICQFEYNYALSCWFNIDAFPPSTSSMYNKYTTILNYGEKPNIKYKASTNTLIITVQQDDDNSNIKQIINKFKKEHNYNNQQITQKLKEIGIELDEFGNRIVYKNTNVLLQKWNYLVINYTGGTLDIFLNGKLERSSIEVVPFMKYDNLTIGAQNGISGGIASLIYFRQPLTILEIHGMYNKFKHDNPPVFPNTTKVLTGRKVIHK